MYRLFILTTSWLSFSSPSNFLKKFNHLPPQKSEHVIYAMNKYRCFVQFDGYIDLDPYDTIAVKLKGDGRCYISTVSFLPSVNVMHGT